MDKISLFYITQLMERFETDNLFDLVQELSSWLSGNVRNLMGLNSFNEVQKELLSVAQFIVQGKTLTRRSVTKLIKALKNMQKEMLIESKIILFVTPNIKVKFNKNIKVIKIENQEECIDIAYNSQEELKYLLYAKNDPISSELENAVDIVISFEELIDASNVCYPIDMFTYDRLYLTAKLNKIEKEKSKILLAGSSYTMVGLLEEKMPELSSNVGVNAQDLYYTLLSAKEAIRRSENLDTIVISLAYYFFFSDMNIKPSDYMLSVLSKVNYPVYKKLHGYTGELLPIYSKVGELPIYEAIVDIESVRDVYYSAITRELENMPYYNKINVRPEGGMLSYNFRDMDDEKNYLAGKSRANGHNGNFDLDRGLNNKNLLDKFLDDMEELDKKVIFFIPPATKFYREGILPDMINVYSQLVIPVINSHKNCKIIDLFSSDEFNENDFQDYDHLNINGANKLSEIISKNIKEW